MFVPVSNIRAYFRLQLTPPADLLSSRTRQDQLCPESSSCQIHHEKPPALLTATAGSNIQDKVTTERFSIFVPIILFASLVDLGEGWGYNIFSSYFFALFQLFMLPFGFGRSTCTFFVRLPSFGRGQPLLGKPVHF